MPGVCLRVTWEQSQEILFSFVGGSGHYDNVMSVHPYTFVKMVSEKFGADPALDMLKIFMKDRIENLADCYFEKFNLIHYRNLL